jgi:hypothetical protein
MMQADAGARTNGQLEVGQWYEDDWMSPYARLRFIAPSDNPMLTVTYFSPPLEDMQRTISIRQGATDALLEQDLLSGALKTLTQTISAAGGESVDILIRVEPPWVDKLGEDARTLGIVVMECLLDAKPDFVEEIEDKPA